MNTRDQIKAAIEAAFDFVHTDERVLHRQCTSEHGLVNMGQEPADFAGYVSLNRPETFFQSCWQSFYQQSESDEMAEGMEAERRFFDKDVTRDIAAVKKKGLPLTVRNCRQAFLKEGPFAKKAKAKK